MLELAMGVVQARELLDNPYYARSLTMEGFHRLLIRAGYPPDVAHEAAKQRGWDRLSAGEIL